jgi:FkbM family methyltransferase
MKKIIELILATIGLYNFSFIMNVLKIPQTIILNEIKNNNLKYYLFIGKKFFLKKDILNLKQRIKRDYIIDIKVDDLNFKMSFLNYDLSDRGITERINGIREPNTVTAIKSLVKNNSKVLVLGACYGYFTNIVSKMCGQNGMVVSVEGLPQNYNILVNNIKLNNLNNVRTYNFFVTNKLIYNNEMRFKKNSTNPYYEIEKLNSNFLEDVKSDYDVVPVVKLSNFLNQINFNPDIIFMDIEGFEVDVIEDLNENYFHKNKPNMVFEIHQYFYKNNKNLEYLKSILQLANYNVRLDKDNLICLQN